MNYKTIESMIMNAPVTLVEKIHYYSCLSSQPEVEFLDYLIYQDSPWLVFPMELPRLNERFVEGLIRIHKPQELNNAKIYSKQFEDLIETRITSLMIEQSYPLKSWERVEK